MPNSHLCDRCGVAILDHIYQVERRRRHYDEAGRLIASEREQGFDNLCSECYRRDRRAQS